MTGLEKLLQRKLPAEIFKAVKEALDPEDLDYVPRSRLDDVIEERDTARADLRKVQKAGNDTGDLQKKLDDLQAKYDADIAAKDAQINSIQREHKIDAALEHAKARNPATVKALLNEEALKDDLSGLEEEIKRITQSDPYLFTDAPDVPAGTGKTQPGAGENDGKDKGNGDASEPTVDMYDAVFGGGIF